jgi:O-antigen ligase
MHRLVLLSLVLVAGLSSLAVSPYTSVYIAFGATLLCGVLMARSVQEVLMHPTYLALLAACAVLAITVPFVWRGPEELMIVLWMLPIPMTAGVVAALRVEPRFGTAPVVGAFCLVGAIGAMATGTYGSIALETARAGGENNPIHFAGIATILGFSALVGIFQNTSRWRFLFLSGPVFGIAAVLLSGSRGPILSALVLFVVIIPLLVYWFRHIWLFWAVPLVLGVAIVASIMVIAPAQYHYVVDAVASSQAAAEFLFDNNVASLTSEPENIDGSTWQRLIFLRGAIDAFLASPVIGHGASQLISAAASHFPPGYEYLGGHLHSDIADFAVVAGLLGIVAFVLILLSPFFALLRAKGTEKRRAIVILSLTLGVGYFTLGLTNAVFGILPQTLLYGILVAVVTNMSLGEENTQLTD